MISHRQAAALGLAAMATVVGLFTLATGRTDAQGEQSDFARRLLGDNVEQRSIALSTVEQAGPQNADRPTRAVMIAALAREADVHISRYEADRRGQPVDTLPDPEFVGRLSKAVAELRDARAIPALAAALFTGPLMARALSDFGDEAAPAVLQVVTAPNGWYDQVDAGLVALRFMVERRAEHPLSGRTMDRIRSAAKQRLNGKQYFTTLTRAIDLAAVLDDAELRQILTSIASDRNELLARGVENPDLLERTQQLAADRLAGVPALPRP